MNRRHQRRLLRFGMFMLAVIAGAALAGALTAARIAAYVLLEQAP